MKKHIFIVGLNDKDTKTQLLSDVEAKENIMRIVGDCSMQLLDGCYTHENGERVIEKSYRVEMLFKTDEEVKGYAQAIKRELNQESIVYDFEETNSRLI